MGKTALATNIAFHAAKNIQEKGEKSCIAFFLIRNVFRTIINKNSCRTIKN